MSFSRILINFFFFFFVIKQCGEEAGKEKLTHESGLIGNCGSLSRTLLRVLLERREGRE
jgi:hypothetical protein